MVNAQLKSDGLIFDYLNNQITDIYDGYRSEQQKNGTKHYSLLWFEKKIYMPLN